MSTLEDGSLWSEYETLLGRVGIPLDTLGLEEVALRRSDALMAVSILVRNVSPILGGDVYWQRGGIVEPAYANWATQPQTGESKEARAARSGEEAVEYIKGFPAKPGSEPLFS